MSSNPPRPRCRPLLARLSDWVQALGAAPLAQVSDEAAEHLGPLTRLAERADHQMSEVEEHLYAELSATGSGACGRLRTRTSHRSCRGARSPYPTVPERCRCRPIRGLATDADAAVRRAAYEAELRAWPTVELPVAAAMNAIKGEANSVNRRRGWESPLDASLFANSVGRATFEAMQAAVRDSLPDFRRWMRLKASLHANHVRSRPRPGTNRPFRPPTPNEPFVPAPTPERTEPALAVVGPGRAAAGGARRHVVGRGRRRRALGVPRVQPGARRPRRPCARRAMDRRATRRGASGRRASACRSSATVHSSC